MCSKDGLQNAYPADEDVFRVAVFLPYPLDHDVAQVREFVDGSKRADTGHLRWYLDMLEAMHAVRHGDCARALEHLAGPHTGVTAEEVDVVRDAAVDICFETGGVGGPEVTFVWSPIGLSMRWPLEAGRFLVVDSLLLGGPDCPAATE